MAIAEIGHWPSICCSSELWTAVCVYVLAAIIKKELALDVSLYTFLQIVSVHSFEKIQLFHAFQDTDDDNDEGSESGAARQGGVSVTLLRMRKEPRWIGTDLTGRANNRLTKIMAGLLMYC
jgi:hypothetical protein